MPLWCHLQNVLICTSSILLCVKTNVNYCVAGSFVIQRETWQAIAEVFRDVTRSVSWCDVLCRYVSWCFVTWCVSWVEPIMVAKIFQDWLQWSWNKSNQRSLLSVSFKNAGKKFICNITNLRWSFRIVYLGRKLFHNNLWNSEKLPTYPIHQVFFP